MVRARRRLAVCSLLVEFSNILATYQRLGTLDLNPVAGLMNDAEMRIPGLIQRRHLTALCIAQQYRIAAYGARFVATAEK